MRDRDPYQYRYDVNYELYRSGSAREVDYDRARDYMRDGYRADEAADAEMRDERNAREARAMQEAEEQAQADHYARQAAAEDAYWRNAEAEHYRELERQHYEALQAEDQQSNKTSGCHPV